MFPPRHSQDEDHKTRQVEMEMSLVERDRIAQIVILAHGDGSKLCCFDDGNSGSFCSLQPVTGSVVLTQTLVFSKA
jgi:hypothetical protein